MILDFASLCMRLQQQQPVKCTFKRGDCVQLTVKFNLQKNYIISSNYCTHTSQQTPSSSPPPRVELNLPEKHELLHQTIRALLNFRPGGRWLNPGAFSTSSNIHASAKLNSAHVNETHAAAECVWFFTWIDKAGPARERAITNRGSSSRLRA